MEQPKGHGLIIEPLKDDDYVAGVNSKLSGEVINPSGDWTPYVFDQEHQAPKYETNACASFGTVDAAQALLKHYNSTEKNLSDRFVAKLSDTDPKKGNTPQKVAQTFRENWSCLETEWPMPETLDEYYAPVPLSLKDVARKLQGPNTFWYHAIQNPTPDKIRDELKRGTVCMSVPAWAIDGETDQYYRPAGWVDNHWVWVLKVNDDGSMSIKDTYPPTAKTLRKDFIPEVAYRYTLNEPVTDIWVRLRDILKRLRDYLLANPPKPQPKPIPQPAPETMQQMVRRKCKENGLSLKLSDQLYATVQCESGFNPKAKFENKKDGKVWSTDWGICQINDYWWIGPGKKFPSVDYVLNNPEACIDWMCKEFKAGNEHYWVCWQKQFGGASFSGYRQGQNRYIPQ